MNKNTKTTKDFAQVIRDKRAFMELVEVLIRSIDEYEKDRLSDYRVIGKEDKQASNWKTGELYWTDENGERTTENTGVPYYSDKYGYVLIDESEYTDEMWSLKKVIDGMRETLASMV